MRPYPAVNGTVNLAAHYALFLVQSRYGNDAQGENRLSFHALPHTVSVMARAEALAKAMGGSAEEVMLSCIAAAFHDVWQNWEKSAPDADERVMRRRFAGSNEAASADEAVEWMRSVGRFKEGDDEVVRQAILATVPSWDVAAGTVVQPNLMPDSSLVVRAVAMADLATAGMDPEDYVDEGDSIFREDNLDIAAAIAHGEIPQDKQDAYKARMLAWRAIQPGFARGRKLRLEAELGNSMSDEAKQCVRALFMGFDDSIAAAEKALSDRKDLPFWDMAKVMGYSIPSA